MISVTKLLMQDSDHYGDGLRYHKDSGKTVHGTRKGHGPVVVWNCTRTCNLNCIHCYSDSDSNSYSGELSTKEAKTFIDDLQAFNVPVLLFSGGEPLLRNDFFELAEYAAQKGIRSTISTNGTLIDKQMAKDFKKIGISYVGISLDGIGENNDNFRGQSGAFQDALAGIRNCLEEGQKVGLRFTINRHNYKELPDIFKLIKEENIPRVCFYHLVYSGRGSEMKDQDISPEETREVLDLIMEKTLEFARINDPKEILMVANHADGIYIYQKMLQEDPAKAQEILKLLGKNGGNRSGIAISSVDSQGWVHPDQFTQNHTFGNVKERPFGEIWTDTDSNEILRGLKDRKPLLKGRCSQCRWLDYCNGNFRARAESVYHDFWASDPACYLTDKEIGLK
ncbi:putative heme d1 biosynthesis radical SAM protein NirJ1 [Natranaerobius thermophilus]|uniref:Mycofactocin maturase MftC n=1 Tax=Natranaerobius thermophilus (strain ATCC BAA-1301 / DSM 18059 / JW/NM-WN-LF) TaxID=457570 RepID=B2A1G9_NATTJ|nr:putative heme d1 biosynthesis radical SAM protein NirJ1 [Natranaerobius thermophilus]ACB84709.1 Radical SAM domain protein [Natranaerobius thermophilus JW/NM-WN-LF]